MRSRRSLNVQLMPDEHKKLDMIADMLGIGKADLIRTCIRKLPLDKDEVIKWSEDIHW